MIACDGHVFDKPISNKDVTAKEKFFNEVQLL